jgi:hypothetical protein
MTWYLRNSNSPGPADTTPFRFGAPGWIPLAGDWTGSGHTGIGVFDPATATFYLRNEAGPGAPDAGTFRYGGAGWIPVVGDWDGNGTSTVGVVDPATETWYLRNSNSAGGPDIAPFAYGAPGWHPVVGDWDGNGTSTIGVVDGQGTWYLRNRNGPGGPDVHPFAYGAAGWLALTDARAALRPAGQAPPTTSGTSTITGPDGASYMLTAGGSLSRNDGSGWKTVSTVKASDGSLWFLSSAAVDNAGDHAIYRFSGNQVVQMPGSGNNLFLGGSSVWETNASSDTFQWDGGKWEMIPHAISAKWLAMGGSSGTLGTPLSATTSAPTQYGQAIEFTGGLVYAQGTQAARVVMSQDGSQQANSGSGFSLTAPPRIALVGNTIQVVGNHDDSTDTYENSVSVVRESGDLVNGFFVRLTIYWTGGGFYLTTPGPWVYTKFISSTNVASVSISGSGDNEAVVPTGVATSGFQAVQITGLPEGTPQTPNTCGPNSAWRVIQAYGGVASYQELIDNSSENSVIASLRLGTTGSTLVDAMNADRRGYNVPVFSLRTGQGVQDVINALKSGKPVVAMVRVPGDETVGVGGTVGNAIGGIGNTINSVFGTNISTNPTYTVPQLHWIAVYGFDVRTGTIYYMDTDGSSYQESVNDFANSFTWDVGPIPNGFLQSVGVVPGTFIA